MKALSIWQPWAWLILHGGKDIENRSWPTQQRGIIAVHTGKKFDQEGYDFVRAEWPEIQMPKTYEFERGGIVGTVKIVDCVKQSGSPWFFGPFGFVLKDPKASPLQAFRGRQGFFTYPWR